MALLDEKCTLVEEKANDVVANTCKNRLFIETHDVERRREQDKGSNT